ncbi:MAG: type I-U CRISPR-associated helicase/endonuclease Cas3, partial [Gammaproteobacteria bacterium]|nr:type I-U CRISPR-associated helicase/endonuclease Cas3 [Gammaproteobacteria bacterium]
MSLKPGDFAHFLAGVHGHSPFPWQQTLVDELAASNAWPDVLNLPTGAGKTAALDAAVFHLALRVDEPQRAALRICLVVDRRLVVDDAHIRAERLATALSHPESVQNPQHRRVVTEVAKRLASLAENRSRPLVVQRLRGGAPLETEWARTPTQPVILCSTVDQVGSRLLFRGYGVSARMRPIHAGLLGCNTLVLVDEAHLSQPFLQTLTAVQALGQARIRLALLSATPGRGSGRQLRLSEGDRNNAVLKRRLTAHKPARLVKAPPQAAAPAVFRERATSMMSCLIAEGVEAPAVAVIVNRVQLARDVFGQLTGSEFDAILLIGRCRSIVRDRIVTDRLAPFRTGSDNRSTAAPLFVVATQCLEVGVDVDLDGLVTQAAPL